MADQDRNWELVLPDGFDDYDWSASETKGFLGGAYVDYGGRRIPFIFYDPVRMGQEAEWGTEDGQFVYEPNVVVVKTVTRDAVHHALEEITKYGQLDWLF